MSQRRKFLINYIDWRNMPDPVTGLNSKYDPLFSLRLYWNNLQFIVLMLTNARVYCKSMFFKIHFSLCRDYDKKNLKYIDAH